FISLHLLSQSNNPEQKAQNPLQTPQQSQKQPNLHTQHTTIPNNHKLSWKTELNRGYPSEVSHQNWEKIEQNDQLFQELVNRRCVENIRMLIVDTIQYVKAGHAGMALGMFEVGHVLYREVMKYNPKNPKWFDRDRFVLSAGHGCLLQYVCLHLAGFHSVQIEDLMHLCKLGSHTPGHPENIVTEGIEVTIVSLAGHWKLNKLTLIYDDNRNTIDGSTDLVFSEDICLRFKALGWNTITVENIHEDEDSLKNALQSAADETEKPTLKRVKALIGKLSEKEGTSKAYHGTFDEDDVKRMREKIQAEQGEQLEKEWYSKLDEYQRKYPKEANEFQTLRDECLIPGWETSMPKWTSSDPVDATRTYSGKCLNNLVKVLPALIGGSYEDFKPNSKWGRNIRYGVREHAMGGISNGIALHGGGLIPFASTFLIFSDYMKSAIRLSAVSHARVIYILSHDSIGLGEDGPTHQPIEQLAGLRAIPRPLVFRPGDGNETAGAFKVAIANRDGPSVIALSRQKVAASVEGTTADSVQRGGYIVSDNSGRGLPQLILIGTLFDMQPQEYEEYVLPSSVTKRVSVEAGSTIGWREYVGGEGVEFGAGGACLDAFKKFGFTEENMGRISESLLSLS
ncbi:Transketolase-like, pyrimidine-binding domain, partial [Dillenia turbinata]